MTEQFKTLNELYKEKCKEQGLNPEEWHEAEHFSFNELKAEAVKWIKKKYIYDSMGNEAVRYFIKTFFDLTEEDFK